MTGDWPTISSRSADARTHTLAASTHQLLSPATLIDSGHADCRHDKKRSRSHQTAGFSDRPHLPLSRLPASPPQVSSPTRSCTFLFSTPNRQNRGHFPYQPGKLSGYWSHRLHHSPTSSGLSLRLLTSDLLDLTTNQTNRELYLTIWTKKRDTKTHHCNDERRTT